MMMPYFLPTDCDKENDEGMESDSVLDESISTADCIYFGSQDMSIENPCFLDSILSQSPSHPEEERKLVEYLDEITSSKC